MKASGKTLRCAKKLEVRSLSIIFLIAATAFLSGCSSSTPADASPNKAGQDDDVGEIPVSITMKPYRYCMAKNDRWMMELVRRIDKSLPARFEPITTQYKEVAVQTAVIDGVISEGKKQMLLRVTAIDKEAGLQHLMAIGIIDPDTCKVDDMGVVEGWSYDPSSEPVFRASKQ